MDFRLPQDEFKNHPTTRNFGSDCPIDYDQEVWLRIQAENLAEREGMTVDAAKEAIRSNGGCAEYSTPREKIYPLSVTVTADGE